MAGVQIADVQTLDCWSPDIRLLESRHQTAGVQTWDDWT